MNHFLSYGLGSLSFHDDQENILGKTSYHLRPGWHLDGEHTHSSAAAAVPALLIVHMDSHFLVGL